MHLFLAIGRAADFFDHILSFILYFVIAELIQRESKLPAFGVYALNETWLWI